MALRSSNLLQESLITSASSWPEKICSFPLSIDNQQYRCVGLRRLIVYLAQLNARQKNLSLSVERRYTAKFFDEATTCRERTQTTQTRIGFVRLDPIVCLARPYPFTPCPGKSRSHLWSQNVLPRDAVVKMPSMKHPIEPPLPALLSYSTTSLQKTSKKAQEKECFDKY
jgi:hypothetical protein